MFATVLTIRDVKFHRVGAFLGNLEQPADSRKDVLFVDFEKNVANPESDAKKILHSGCQTLSSSAFVSSPLYGPSCFPVIISSVSVSLVLIMSQVSPVMSPYNSLFYPMLLVDYC